MNGLRRHSQKITCGLAAAAVSFGLTLHFTGAPVTYSKFASRADNANNAFTMNTWVTKLNVLLVFDRGVSSVSRSVYEAVYDAVYTMAGNNDGILYAYITLPDDFDPSNVDVSSVKLEYDGQQIDALSFEIDKGGLSVSFDWSKVAAWIEKSGQDSIDATISGTSTDGYFTFSGTGTIWKDMPSIIR